jgi:TolB-like protein/DNA-binding winged helix-turn-helix (wHTH) protein/tetratricopeptide (TPR) repeat protein
VFEADLRREELRKQGMRVRLRGHPFDILAMLLERPGDLVTREELRDRLWPADSFVDFDHGLNAAVNRLREALGDAADNPRFIETVPRRGYRFIAPLIVVPEPPPEPPPPAEAAPPQSFLPIPAATRRRRWRTWTLAGATLAALAAAVLWQQPWATPWKRPAVQRVAVLPFENASADPDQAYLADGVTEALITNLAQVAALRVVSRTSAMAYRGSTKPLPQIARELNVDAIVRGSVSQSGTRVGVSAWLVDAARSRPLWADTYQRNMTDIVALEGEIARAIAQGARVPVTTQEEVRLLVSAPVNPGAYAAWLRGRSFRETLPDVGVSRGAAAFEEAVERDPLFARGYEGLADCYWNMSSPGFETAPRTETAPKARAAALKALELDPHLAAAEATLAMIEMEYDWRWQEGESRMKRVLAANPSLASAHLAYSTCLSGMGRFDAALAEARLGADLDPLSVTASQVLGGRLFYARQYDRAALQFRKALEASPTAFVARLGLARCYWQTDDWKRAIPEAERALADSETNLWALAWLGYAYGASGDRPRGRNVLGYLETLTQQRHVPSYYRALVHAGLDEEDEAFQDLERACAERSGWMMHLKVAPEFDRIRADPRFGELLGRIGFE